MKKRNWDGGRKEEIEKGIGNCKKMEVKKEWTTQKGNENESELKREKSIKDREGEGSIRFFYNWR